MNRNVVSHKETGELYEIQYVVHPRPSYAGSDVYAAYRLSRYDGMPIGPRVWIEACVFIDADRHRMQTRFDLPVGKLTEE